LTRLLIDDKLVSMTVQDMLRRLVNEKGLRQTARELGIDSGALYRSINSDLRIGTAQKILDFFGYDLKIVKRKEVNRIRSNRSLSRRK
jgi:hypothetical protein